MPPIRVAVIGAGAFGRNHLRVYRELELAHPDLVQLAALVEPDPTRRSHFANLYNIPTFASVAEMLSDLNANQTHPFSAPTDSASGQADSGLLGTGFSPSITSAGEAGALAPDASDAPSTHTVAALLGTGFSPSITSAAEAGALAPEASGAASTQPKAALLGTGFSPSITSAGEAGALAPEAIPQAIHAASICVPTTQHAAIAEQLLRANLDILIEKPFAATLTEADHIIALAQQNSRIVAIGHLERFNPAVTATLAALNNPMFFEAHRLSIFTPRSLDVDVVLDLMIHDLDIVLSLTNSPVKEVRAVGLPILSRKTDIANVRIEFASGCVANFTASRVSTEQVRKLRLFQPHQYLSLDFARQELLTISVDPSAIAAAIAAQSPANPSQTLSSRPEAALFAAAAETGVPNERSLLDGVQRPASPATAASSPTTPAAATHAAPDATSGPPIPAGMHHPTAGLSLNKADIPRGEPLRLELENFLNSIQSRTPPRVPAEAGRAALALALEINAQIAAHAHRAGLA
jgi:predicted dehydrogenase